MAANVAAVIANDRVQTVIKIRTGSSLRWHSLSRNRELPLLSVWRDRCLHSTRLAKPNGEVS